MSAYLQVSVKKRSCTTVNKSSRIRPLRTTFWSGAVMAGFEENTYKLWTLVPSGLVSISPSLIIGINRLAGAWT